jgi:hypothetical protein
MAATDGNGMHSTVRCYSVVHCWEIFISKRQKKMFPYPKCFYTLSKRRFLVIQGFMQNEKKSDQIFLNRATVFICPGNVVVTIIFCVLSIH